MSSTEVSSTSRALHTATTPCEFTVDASSVSTLGGDDAALHTPVLGRGDELGMLLGGLLGDEQLNDGAVARQCLTDGLRTFD